MLRPVLLVILILIVVGAAVIALWPLRVVSAITSRNGYTTQTGIAYGALASQRLDVYTPDGVAAAAPVLVFFHGGSWSIGDKDEYGFVGQAFASAGMVVVIPGYRLSPPVVFPTFVEDGAAAVAWVAKNFPGRPVFLAGHSAGAHIAALVALDRHYLADAGAPVGLVAGFIGISGPYDFLPLTEERYKRVFPEATRDASQPIRFADSASPPTLLITGEKDTTVLPGNSIRLAAAIAAKGGQATVKIYPGVRHLGTMMALAKVLIYPKPPVRRDVIDFVRSVMGK